jgi:oxygen-independent coproporphyrinogen-3 oxidase
VRSPAGIYLSIPFCKAKCSFCNFASDAFGMGRLGAYVDRLCDEINQARQKAEDMGALLGFSADTVYFGGGTPSLLSPDHVRQIFSALRGQFEISDGAEITVECAPGQLNAETLEAFQRQGVNRISLGVQSFVDREARAVGRLHTGAECEAEIARLQRAGIEKTGIDLIVGLPHQTEASWRESLQRAIESGVGHVSVYMLEVDEESRLGREALAGGVRYGAGELPSDDEVAGWYELGCELLNAGELRQYEISNFASAGHVSRHNAKYWQRLPYIGFGLDAHSMLCMESGAVRFRNVDELHLYMAGGAGGLFPMAGAQRGCRETEFVSEDAAFEEALFLGLRMLEGVKLSRLQEEFGEARIASVMSSIREVCDAGLMRMDADLLRLTARGRMVSNEVFSRLLIADPAEV